MHILHILEMIFKIIKDEYFMPIHGFLNHSALLRSYLILLQHLHKKVIHIRTEIMEKSHKDIYIQILHLTF